MSKPLLGDPVIDAESRKPEIVAILSVFTAVSTIAVVLRCHARLFLLRCFGLDDAVMVAAQVLTIASAVAIGIEAAYGLGRHTWVIPERNLIPYMKAFYASIVVYNVAVCLTKISILLQYKRLFANPIVQRITLTALCFLAAWAVALAFLLTLICQPVATFWDSSIPGHCLDITTVWYVMAGVNLVTDFLILTLPMPVISSLQLPSRQKYMLMGVFCLGFLYVLPLPRRTQHKSLTRTSPCAISVYRIRTLGAVLSSPDPTYENVDAATWSFLELTTGVLAACLPTLRPLFIAVMPRLFASARTVVSLSRSRGERSMGGTTARRSVVPTTLSGMGWKDDGMDSMEELRGVSREQDLEEGKPAALRAYEVSVVAERERQQREFGLGVRGIKATTVVTRREDR